MESWLKFAERHRQILQEQHDLEAGAVVRACVVDPEALMIQLAGGPEAAVWERQYQWARRLKARQEARMGFE
jgi:hypothetical protein